MPKTKYTATFANGDVLTRSSDRVYTYAWRITASHESYEPYTMRGFAATEGLARRAANACRPAKFNKAKRRTMAYKELDSCEIVPCSVVER